MGKLSTVTHILDWIRVAFVMLWRAIVWIFQKISLGLSRLRNWLRVHVPFVEAVVQRHIHNPATVFIDIAIFILFLYVTFGAIGWYSIYHAKTDSRFSETISVIYPFPAAKVDNSYIWSTKFLKRLRFLNTFNSQAPEGVAQNLPKQEEIREQVIAGLIEDQIIFLEAVKLGVRVTREEIDQAFDQQKTEIDNFEEQLNKLYGISSQEFKQVIAERILREKVKGVVLTRVKLRHILTVNLATANQALARLNAGESFEEVAAALSQDSQTKDTGGNLGYWTKGELASAVSSSFEETAFNLPVNQISSPIQSGFGFHIIEVTDRSDNQFATYSEWYQQTLKNYKVRIFIPY